MLTSNFYIVINIVSNIKRKQKASNKLYLEYSLFRIGQSLWILISICEVNRIFSSAFLFILFSLWQKRERQHEKCNSASPFVARRECDFASAFASR